MIETSWGLNSELGNHMRITNRLVFVAFALMLAFLPEWAFANNNYFLPGDAFYYAEPNHEWFAKLDKTEKPILKYQRARGRGGRLCGYAGYDQLQLTNFTPEMRTNLLKAYEQLRNRYPQQIDVHLSRKMKMENGKLVPAGEEEETRVEHNLVSMLIYNRDFDLKEYEPMFRYNENWADAAAAFGHTRKHVEHDLFIEDAKSIIKDWRLGPLVKPLKYSAPQASEKNARLKNVMISVDCNDIQILLFPTSNYEDIAFPEDTFVHRLASSNRGVPPEYKMSGGMFSVQDKFGSQTDVDHEQDSEDDREESEKRVPYYAYRATVEKMEILRPKRGRWVVANR